MNSLSHLINSLIYVMLLNHSRILFLTRIFLGQFSEAGLHESVHFVIFRAKSHERWDLPLPGRFLSRLWITLCITMGFEHTTTNETVQMPELSLFARITGIMWWRMKGKKGLLGFPADRKIVSAWEKMHFLASCYALVILGRGSALVLRISPSVVVRGCPRGRKWPLKSRDCCH